MRVATQADPAAIVFAYGAAMPRWRSGIGVERKYSNSTRCGPTSLSELLAAFRLILDFPSCFLC